jgi:hypothetical protein
VVFIFAKTADEELAMLAKEIDALVVSEKEKKLAAVINIVGEANDELAEKLKKFGEKQGLKKVPLAATTDGDVFEINDKAEVTVMTYRGKKVKFNYALAKGGLDKKTIAAIVEDTKKMLAEPPEKVEEKPKDDKAKPEGKPKGKKAKPKKKPEAKAKEEPKEKPPEKPAAKAKGEPKP